MTPERIVEFAEGLAGISAAGGGPKALAAYLAETAGCGVLVEDAQWRHIAAAGGDLPPTARGNGAGRTHKIVAGSAQLGWLSMFDGTRGGGDALLDALGRLTAAAIGIELAREGGAARSRRRGFWERLLSGAYHDTTAARDDAAAHGITPSPAYVVVALERDAVEEERSPGDLAELRALAADVFRGGDADLGFFERGATLLVLVPAVREIEASNARTAATLLPKSFAKRKPNLRLSGGVGTVESLLSANVSAGRAEAALAIGRRVLGAGRVSVYDELGAYPMLYEGADVARLEAFAHRELAPLRAYDEKHQTELEKTLRLYFEVGQNVKTAAAQLNVHRHTVFYRLRQIAELCSRSLESPHDQLTLRLAVAIDALHSS
ncbi:MAG: helix-turn-helix domain-containing protein [Candidatus Eremiobacteraeota bacterium]|nr:helix-turn-helix domain-containing protein [Candidatus Eremiobacteraeota bacterium]